jgi:hypothetical protein
MIRFTTSSSPTPASFPKWEQPKIKLQNLAHFLSPQNRLLKHYVHHTSHHVFTTKTPQKDARFFQKPQQKRTSPRLQKLLQQARILPAPQNRQHAG